MLNRFVNKVKLIMALALILLVFNTTAFAGEWTNTKENIKFWNEYPFAGTIFSWDGAKDAENYANGKGKLTTYIDNEVIEVFSGNMKKGKFQGKATIDIVGIVIYEGNVVDSKMHGKGSLIWSNGDSYKGEFVINDKLKMHESDHIKMYKKRL